MATPDAPFYGPNPASTYARLIRRHWAIENRVHWQPNLPFREGQYRLRKGNAAINATILRKTARQLLGQELTKIGYERKRKRAACDNKYLAKLLHK